VYFTWLTSKAWIAATSFAKVWSNEGSVLRARVSGLVRAST
jgi:hypothetical protein